MTDEQLDKLAGPDAVQYIRLVKESLDNVLGVLKLKWNHFATRFQKYLLVLIGITTLFCTIRFVLKTKTVDPVG